MEPKETYYRTKRDLLWNQKRPTMEPKETYYRTKRDLLICTTCPYNKMRPNPHPNLNAAAWALCTETYSRL